METRFSIKFLPAIFFSFAVASASFAQEAAPNLQTIGQVAWVKGTVKATQPNAPARSLARRSPIYEHDTLTTDPASTSEIVFTDDSVLALQESSTLQISEYKHGKGTAPKNDAFVANVVKGGFRTITGAISKNNPSGYKSNTPVATIGVSGTMYSVYFNPLKRIMDAKLDKGSISVANTKGRVTLTKCKVNDQSKKNGEGCTNQLFATVSSKDSAPIITLSQSAVFNNEPPLTAVSFSSVGGVTSGGGVDDSFCIK